MKYVKILGLAAVAAMAIMALAAGTASATTLKMGTTTVTKIEASLTGSAALKDTEGTVLATCAVGGVSGTTTKDSAEELTGPATVTWGPKNAGCTQTTDTLNGGTLGITWLVGTISGTVRSYKAEVTVELFGVSCVYGTPETGKTLGTLEGSETTNATIEINTPVQKTGGGFLCPASTVWKANYIVTNPKPLRVVE